MNYTMSRFEVAAVVREKKQTPEQYIARVGGLHAARANYNTLYAQLTNKEMIGPFWRQIDGILRKAGV